MVLTDQIILDAYTGLNGFSDGSYLIQYPQETTEQFQERQKRCYYFNIVSMIMNIYLGYLFGLPVKRDSVNKQYADFVERADGRRCLDAVMEQAMEYAMLLGTVALIVDRPIGDPVSAADMQLPYVAIRLPSQISDIKLDQFGNVYYAVFSEKTVIDGKEQTIYRIYDGGGWIVAHDTKGEKVIDSGTYTIGRPPVVLLHSKEPELGEWRAQGWAYPLVQIAYAMFLHLSDRDRLFRAQAFAMLTIPTDNVNAFVQLMEDKQIVTGPGRAIPFSAQSGGSPAFIAPDSGPIKSYMELIMSLTDDAFRMANLQFINNVSKGVQDVQIWWRLANASLSKLARFLEEAEEQVATYVAAWGGVEWDAEESISYPKEFSLPDITALLKNADMALNLEMGDTFEAELKRMIASHVLGDEVSQEVMSQIATELQEDQEEQEDVFAERIAQETVAQVPVPPTGGMPESYIED